MEELKESLAFVSQGSNIHEAQIPMLSTIGNEYANYSIFVERAWYNGGLQAQLSGSLPLLNHIHQEDLSSYWKHSLQFANGSPFSIL